MTVVLVHGNPETPAVWAPLVEAWGRDDVMCLNLPGFGCPRPAGFAATKEDYLAWLIAELEARAEPVHLVGHDWGGGLVGRLAMVRPDLLVSWASDALGLFHPRYVWHDAARIWQTPGEGEALISVMLDIPLAERTAGFAALGIPEASAAVLASAADAEMGACVLSLSLRHPARHGRVGNGGGGGDGTAWPVPPCHRGPLCRHGYGGARRGGDHGRHGGRARGTGSLVDARGPSRRSSGARGLGVRPLMSPVSRGGMRGGER